MRGLIIGRFQPFHLGHLSVIQDLAKKIDAIIIGIGSAQYSHTLTNPFTAGERHLMISRSLEDNNILNYYLVPIEDVHVYNLWVAHVEALVPPFDVFYTNNPLNARLFREKGYTVEGMKMYDRRRYSGTIIREKIIKGERWEELVPRAVVEVIEEVDGAGRLRELAKVSDVWEMSPKP